VGKKGNVMKVAFGFKIVVCMVLLSCIVLLAGCTQPGETAAEGRRRHLRNLRLNHKALIKDIDTAVQADEPSSLTELRVP